MADAVVLKSGLVVKILTENYPDGLDEIYFTVVDGKVAHFVYEEVLYWYCNYKRPDYITSSERISQSFDGYYSYIEFLEFKIGKRLANDVSQFRFDENIDRALAGDIITTLKTVFVPDYTNIITFDYEFPYDGTTRYPQEVVIPEGIQGVKNWDKDDLPVGPSGFFSKNYDLVTSYQHIKPYSNFPSIFRNVILAMKNIVSEIFIEFSGSNNQVHINQVIDYWENLYYETTDELSILVAGLQITDLYNALSEFRGNFYTYKTTILEKTGNNFILFLIELAKVAPSQTFESIDIGTKYKMLCEMVKGNMTQANSLESAAITVVQSVKTTQINDFLVYLVQNAEIDTDLANNKTLFELLFRKIDDNRFARYSFGLLQSENNRAIFIIEVFKLWKQSIYNPTFPDPSYYEPPTLDGIYPESFYMALQNVQGSSIKEPIYYKEDISPPVIVYEAPPQNNQHNNTDSEINYTVKMEGKKIKVFEHTYTYELNTTNTKTDNPYIRVPRTRIYGTYDFYQPITIIGFKPNLNLLQVLKELEFGGEQMQEEIPAFFLFYMVDYDDLATLDFSIMFAVELVANFIPGVGALSAISKIRYLKYLSRVRNLETAVATDRVVYWTAREGINNTVEFFAGNALAVNNYINATTNDPDQQELTEKLNYFLGFVMIGSLYSNYRYRTKLISASEDVDFKVLQMNADGKSIYKPGMSDDAKALLDDALLKVKSIAGNKTVSIDAMIYKLTEMQTDGAVILSKFTGFTPAQKYAFAIEYKDFIPQDLTKLNVNNGLPMDSWKDLFDLKIIDRQYIDFVTDISLVNGIKRYYSVLEFRNYLEALSYEKRLEFLANFKNIDDVVFNKMKTRLNSLEFLSDVAIPKSDSLDYFKVNDVLNMINKDLNNDMIGLVYYRNKILVWIESKINFARRIQVESISSSALSSLNSRYVNTFTDPDKLDEFLLRNRLFTNTKIYNNDVLVEEVSENFLSGNHEAVIDILSGTSANFIEPSNISKYKAFVKRAFDNKNRPRYDDTEVKYLFNLFENHFHKGNRFVIEMESVLFSCTSCQRYLQAAKLYAESTGKVFQVKFISHPKARRISSINDIIN